MHRWTGPAMIAALALGGCVDVPELEGTIAPDLERARYPDLVPLDAALGRRPPPREESQELEDELSARVEGLRSRADALQAPLLGDADRQRLQPANRP